MHWKRIKNQVLQPQEQFQGKEQKKKARNSTFKSIGLLDCDRPRKFPQYYLTWNIFRQATPYHRGMKQCHLCLEEKFTIAKADKNTTVNKGSELIGKCRHKEKFKLKNFKIPDPH